MNLRVVIQDIPDLKVAANHLSLTTISGLAAGVVLSGSGAAVPAALLHVRTCPQGSSSHQPDSHASAHLEASPRQSALPRTL
jgi:hypothetical protein